MAYIERAISKVLKNRVRNSKCTLVVGARQVGKSTLIQHDFSEYHRTTFDDQLTRLQSKEEPKLFFLNNPCPLIIDEVQKEPSVLEEIKQIVDAIENHQKLPTEIKTLSDILYKADKLSRLCFDCNAKNECYWSDKKKNHELYI